MGALGGLEGWGGPPLGRERRLGRAGGRARLGGGWVGGWADGQTFL